jgi:hypothetical protein
LYNLAEDIGEMVDLSTSQPDLTADMLGRLEQWKLKIGALDATPNPVYVEGAESLHFRGLEKQ